MLEKVLISSFGVIVTIKKKIGGFSEILDCELNFFILIMMSIFIRGPQSSVYCAQLFRAAQEYLMLI